MIEEEYLRQPPTGQAAMGVIEALRQAGWSWEGLHRLGAVCSSSDAPISRGERVICGACGAEFVGIRRMPIHGPAPRKRNGMAQTHSEYYAGIEAGRRRLAQRMRISMWLLEPPQEKKRG